MKLLIALPLLALSLGGCIVVPAHPRAAYYDRGPDVVVSPRVVVRPHHHYDRPWRYRYRDDYRGD